MTSVDALQAAGDEPLMSAVGQHNLNVMQIRVKASTADSVTCIYSTNNIVNNCLLQLHQAPV